MFVLNSCNKRLKYKNCDKNAAVAVAAVAGGQASVLINVQICPNSEFLNIKSTVFITCKRFLQVNRNVPC